MRDFDWQILVTLHKLRNITKTAEHLFISQPTLTKRIQVIEDELGIPIVIRSRRGTEFTSEGERIAQMAETIVASINEIKTDIASRNKGTKGTLKLGAPYSFVRYALPMMLEHYTKEHPDIEVDIVTALSDELARRVEEDIIDVCFARYDVGISHLERQQVCEDRVYAVYNKPFELKDLPELPYIEFVKNPSVSSTVQRWWNENFSVPRKTRFKVTTGDSCVAMVKRGLGFGIFPDPKYFMFEEGLYSIPLEFSDGTEFTRRTWMLYNKANLKNPVVAGFVDFMSRMDLDANLYDGKPMK